MVKFYKTKNLQVGHDVVLELYINKATGEIDGGALTPYGDSLLAVLRSGKITVDGQKFSFKDREVYLENLHKAFNTPYLTATHYVAQPSKI